MLAYCCASGSALPLVAARLSHRITAQLDTMRVVNDAIQGSIRHGRIADLLMPSRDRKLRGENQRHMRQASLSAFLKSTDHRIRVYR
jgi:hypothetical protein